MTSRHADPDVTDDTNIIGMTGRMPEKLISTATSAEG